MQKLKIMKRLRLYSGIITAIIFTLSTLRASAQPPVKVVAGLIYMNDGTLAPNQKMYPKLTDSLDNNLKKNNKDTGSLFYRALLYLRYNSGVAKPYQLSKGAMENLEVAKNMVERADSLKMQALNLKILRAEIYRELCYRFTGDESWQLNGKQIASRRTKFNGYKDLANKYYDDLAQLDKRNAYAYLQLKINYKYPL